MGASATHPTTNPNLVRSLAHSLTRGRFPYLPQLNVRFCRCPSGGDERRAGRGFPFVVAVAASPNLDRMTDRLTDRLTEPKK